MGYSRAGFDVVGVDLTPQPRYPFEFYQADALTFPLDGFDVIHASPPCQAFTAMRTMPNAREHASLIESIRDRLRDTGKPYIIENVVGAPLHNPVRLCGTMFGLGVKGAELRRHRIFECSFFCLAPTCAHGGDQVIGVYGAHVRNRKRVIGVYGEACRDSRRKRDKGLPDFGVEQGREAMGIDWMTIAELCQAIPPAYTEFLGRHIHEILTGRT